MKTTLSKWLRDGLGGALSKSEFEEDAHPRDSAGRFAPKGEGGAGPTAAIKGPAPEEVDRIFNGRHRIPKLPMFFESSKIDDFLDEKKEMDAKAKVMEEGDFVSGPPESITRVSEQAKSMADALGQRIVDEAVTSTIERIFAVENDSGKVIGMSDGLRAVSPATHIFAEMDRGKGYTVVHNHPDDPLSEKGAAPSFSSGDLVAFTTIPQFTRLVVETGKNRFTLEKPPGWTMQGDKRKRINADYEAVKTELNPQYQSRLRSPEGTKEWWKERSLAFMDHSDHVISVLAEKYGLMHKREKKE